MTKKLSAALLMTLLLFCAAGCDSSGPSGPDGDDCQALRSSMSSQVARGMSMMCTGVVRFDYESLAPLGYQIYCADGASIDETAARAAASADLDLASLPGGPEPGDLISNPAASVMGGEELYVFFKPASDFGHVAVVNARNGLTLFGGSIVRMGSGDVVYPQEWKPASALGSSCTDSSLHLNQVTSFDLTKSSGPISDSQQAQVTQALAGTVMPGALLDGTAAYLKNTVILLYPRTVGEFDPSTAEYVVLLNAGWE
jgi:hypothetical protein